MVVVVIIIIIIAIPLIYYINIYTIFVQVNKAVSLLLHLALEDESRREFFFPLILF